MIQHNIMDNSLKINFSLSQEWLNEKECVVFGVFEGEELPCGLGFKKETVEKEAGKLFPIFAKIKKHFSHGDFKAKLGELAVLYPNDIVYKRIILCGLGEKEKLTAEGLRQAASSAINAAEQLNASRISFTLFGAPTQTAGERLRYIFEGASLGSYKFYGYKSKPESEERKAKNELKEIEFLLPEIIEARDAEKYQNDLTRHIIMSEAVYFARDLTNQPASVVTPTFIVETAEKLSKEIKGVEFRSFGAKELAEMGMGGILEVGKGSAHEPRMAVLTYCSPDSPQTDSKENKAFDAVIVGKGVSFDSGGISLKPSEKMDEMKMDMAGAAAVLGAFLAIAKMGLPVNIAAVAPIVENMPGRNAYRPGDIIKTASGKTIEVLSTDAEGRIILADALHYAVSQFKPKYVVDLATLTGACVVALGHHYAGLFSDDDELSDLLTKAGDETGEKLWAMPFDECYKKQIESDIADVKNVGSGGRKGDAVSAAMFLKEFVGGHKGYAHIDIAGTAMLPERQGYKTKGGSGFGARLLVEFIKNLK